MATRGLSPAFMGELEAGCLTPVLDCVQADFTLCLEVRSDCVNIYYRGGNLLRVSLATGEYVAFMDRKYFGGRDAFVLDELPKVLHVADAASQWVSAFPTLKQAMDIYFGEHPSDECEYKQLVVRDNNGRHGSKSTDYFIVDMEYVHQDARFDFIAAHWPSTGVARKDPSCPRLAFIEMKVGDGAVGSFDGSGVIRHPGLAKHLADIEAFCGPQEDGSPSRRLADLKNEMVTVYEQKHRLRLVDTKHAIKTFSEEKPLFVFLLANHDPDSRKLKDELERLPEAANVDVRFAVGTFMGYGLFHDGMVTLNELTSRFASCLYSGD